MERGPKNGFEAGQPIDTDDAMNDMPKDTTDKFVEGIQKKIADGVYTQEEGDALIAKILIPILGLKDNPPTLKYGDAKGKEGGFYQRSEHSVTICEENLESKSEKEDDRILPEMREPGKNNYRNRAAGVYRRGETQGTKPNHQR